MLNSQNDMLALEIEKKIKDRLNAAGLVYRIFSRAKSANSIRDKIARKDYGNGRKMTDVIGVRVVFYFLDDIVLATEILGGIYSEVERVVDQPNKENFYALRTNYVFRIPDDLVEMFEVNEVNKDVIDKTFEVQFRSILQEGWQEIEHDLRYKCPEDWIEHEDKSRRLNSISATLENCEYSMQSIFDELAYSFYKQSEWERMLHHKFRLRFLSVKLESELRKILSDNKRDAKAIFGCDRTEVIKKILEFKMTLPVTYKSVLFVANRLTCKNELLINEESEIFKTVFPS